MEENINNLLIRIHEIEVELNELADRNNVIYDISTKTVGDIIEGVKSRVIIKVLKQL